MKLSVLPGAMENWGSIFYKEQYLIGEENSHPRDVMRIMTVVAHELGHQFFGNVVTCEWWSYIWLNEGFATLFEYLLVDKVHEGLRMHDFFNVEKVQNAFKVDSVESSHPMTYDGSTITGIIYDKGNINSFRTNKNRSFDKFQLEVSSECSNTPSVKTYSAILSAAT